MKLLRRVRAVLVGLLIFVGTLVLLGFLFRKPIATEMRSQLEAQLEKNGIHANYVVSNFDLLRGLILTDVVIFDSEKKETPVVNLSKIGVAYNLLGLDFTAGNSAVELSTRKTDVSFWEDGASYTVQGITSRISVERRHLEVGHFEASYGDLNVNLKAAVDFDTVDEQRKRKKAEKLARGESEDEDKEGDGKKNKKGLDVTEIVGFLKKIPDTPDGDLAVRLLYNFTGDATEPTIRSAVSGVAVHWNELVFNDLTATVDSGADSRTLQIPEVKFRSGDRSFSLSGAFDFKTKEFQIANLQSSIDLKPILEALQRSDPSGKPVAELPDHRISASGTVNIKKPLESEIEGQFELLTPYSIPMKGSSPLPLSAATCSFKLSRGVLDISHLDASLQGSGDPLGVTGAAALNFDDQQKVSKIDLKGLLFSRGTGSLAVIGDLFPKDEKLMIKELRSDLDFVQALKDLGQKDPLKDNIHYAVPPKFELSGTFAFKDPLVNDLHGTIAVPGKVTVAMGKEKTPLVIDHFAMKGFSFASGRLVVTEADLEVGDEIPTSIQTNVLMDFEVIPRDEDGHQNQMGLTNLVFSSLNAVRDGRELYAEGEFDPKSKVLTLKRLESGLDLMAALGEFGVPNVLSGVVSFPNPPTITATGEIPFGNPPAISVSGSVSSDTGVSVAIGGGKSLTVHEFEVIEFVFRDSKLTIPQILAKTGPDGAALTVDAEVEMITGEQSQLNLKRVDIARGDRSLSMNAIIPLPASHIEIGQLESNIDILAAMADFGIGDPTSGKVRFNEPPQIAARGIYNFKDPSASEGVASFNIPAGFSIILDENRALQIHDFSVTDSQFINGGLNLQGVAAVLDAGNSPVEIASDVELQFYPDKSPIIGIKSFNATRDESALQFVGSIPIGANKLVISEFSSNMNLSGLFADLGLRDPTGGKVIFGAAPTLTAKGDLDLTDLLNNSSLQGYINAPGGLTIPMEQGQDIVLDTLETTFEIRNQTVATPKLEAMMMGGKIEANTVVDPKQSPVQFEAAVRLTGVKLEELARYFDPENVRTGLVSGEFKGGGPATIEGVQGVGNVQVKEAKLTQLTLFKGLRPLLMAINLGEWKSEDMGTEITSNFALNRGVLGSDDIEIVGDFYRIRSKMNLNFVQKTMTAEGAVATTGATRVVTEIVGKILEIEASGPFAEIDWKLKNVGSIKNLTTLSGDLLKNTLSTAAKPGKLIQGAGEIAKDTLDSAAGLGKKILGIGRKKEPAAEDAGDPEKAPEPAAN